jgi:putative flippase GtrA
MLAPMLESVRNRGGKYVLVTALNVAFGQVLLYVMLVGLPDQRRWVINAASVVICAPPAYYANRAWVWDKRGRSDLRREIGPFWVFVGIGLVGTTVTVAAMEAWWRSSNADPMPAVLTNIISLVVIGTIWVVRFFWMDRAFQPVEPSVEGT